MNICDFYSVMQIIMNNIKNSEDFSQMDLIQNVFASFIKSDDSSEFILDSAQICRWLKGQAALSPYIIKFYGKNNGMLENDIRNNIAERFVDTSMTASELYDLMQNDSSISNDKKQELFDYFDDKESFITDILMFAIERKFVAREYNPLYQLVHFHLL